MNNDLLWFRRALSNNDGSWWRRRIVRCVVLCFLADSLNIAAVSVVNVLLDSPFDAVIAVVSALSLDHLVLNLDIIIEQSIKARSSFPICDLSTLEVGIEPIIAIGL